MNERFKLKINVNIALASNFDPALAAIIAPNPAFAPALVPDPSGAILFPPPIDRMTETEDVNIITPEDKCKGKL